MRNGAMLDGNNINSENNVRESRRSEKVFDEAYVDFFLDYKEEVKKPVITNLRGYYFLEYLPDLSKEERKALHKEEGLVS